VRGDQVEHPVAPGAVRFLAFVEVERDDAPRADLRPDEAVVAEDRRLE
jgi:hypothetical protein